MKKRLVSLFVENVPREEVPTWYAEFFVQITGPLKHKIINGISGCGPVIIPSLSHIAELAEVGDSVTRKELMRAYDLVEQGYTLWFDGDFPVDGGTLPKYVSCRCEVVEPRRNMSTTLMVNFINRNGDKICFDPSEVSTLSANVTVGENYAGKHGAVVELLHVGKKNVMLRNVETDCEYLLSHTAFLKNFTMNS